MRKRCALLLTMSALLPVSSELAAQLRADGEWNSAIEYARRSNTLSPYDEQRARELLELLVEAGQVPAAVAFYESFARRLREDLDLTPSAETRALVERIRSAARTACRRTWADRR